MWPGMVEPGTMVAAAGLSRRLPLRLRGRPGQVASDSTTMDLAEWFRDLLGPMRRVARVGVPVEGQAGQRFLGRARISLEAVAEVARTMPLEPVSLEMVGRSSLNRASIPPLSRPLGMVRDLARVVEAPAQPLTRTMVMTEALVHLVASWPSSSLFNK